MLCTLRNVVSVPVYTDGHKYIFPNEIRRNYYCHDKTMSKSNLRKKVFFLFHLHIKVQQQKKSGPKLKAKTWRQELKKRP